MTRKKSEHDFAVNAFRVYQEATKDSETIEIQSITIESKNPHAVALGKLGGSKGGKTRAANLTPERRKEIAHKAARARWEKK